MIDYNIFSYLCENYKAKSAGIYVTSLLSNAHTRYYSYAISAVWHHTAVISHMNTAQQKAMCTERVTVTCSPAQLADALA